MLDNITKDLEKIMNGSGKINVGIGFVTGRKNFRKVLKTYAYRWKDISAKIKQRANLHLFVAYDLDYMNTQIEDFINIQPDVLNILDGVTFIGKSTIDLARQQLVQDGVVTSEESTYVFQKGYAGKRNSILFFAMKHNIDYLIFLDDDEYPLAVSRTGKRTLWSGQNVLTDHLEHLQDADMTNGYHCGYVSPIPHLVFDNKLSESDFRMFIEAVSNDILDWPSMSRIIDNGGVTYAETQILINDAAFEVTEVDNTKFISGSNLGINLQKIQKVKPFYNPPGARGEDTFLSTCLREHKLLRIPTYTFHDGFSAYGHLLDGVLPLELNHIDASNESVRKRFYRACLGWIRYKPLYLRITRPQQFGEDVAVIRGKLAEVVPKLSSYFDDKKYLKIITEFNRYVKQVEEHHQDYIKNQRIWEDCKAYAVQIRGEPLR